MSFIDFNYSTYTFADPTIINPFSPFQFHTIHPPNDAVLGNPSSPKHRHDGTSPLPLGMDWSLPPSNWDGRDSIWPHDPHTGWSFCVTVPSWVDVPQSSGSDVVVFYRVQVGIQSPQGITTSRVILRRFKDFLNLFSDLKKEFPMKNLPPIPPKKILRIISHALLEERRCLLADWMKKLLSDIDVSRSAPAAMFLELEAAARSAFHDMNQHISDELINSTEETLDHATSNKDIIFEHNGTEDKVTSNTLAPGVHDYKLSDHVKRMSMESTGGDLSSLRNSETSNSAATTSIQDDSHDLPVSYEPSRNSDLLVVTSPSDDRPKLNRINTQQQRLTTAETNVEDLIARLNEEMAARQYLMTKVKDLEIELEITRVNFRENMQQAVLTEKERFTQMQSDMEEFRRKCLKMEVKMKSEEDEKLLAESAKTYVIQEKQMLLQNLDVAREQIEHLMKNHDEFVMKSKTDMKLLITEVNSLRSSQLELKQQLSELMKEKLDVESLHQEEKQRMDLLHNVNSKLLHECAILHKRLGGCSVNFLVEEEDKLTIDTSTSDALDLLETSDNQIGVLLAEAQLLAKDVETDTTYDHLKKMLAQVFVDSASLRKQINSLIRCVLNANINA
ncbi:putative Phox domain-containing protein [Lupinus albus]|uniref:Putative Phox domain-containing protein n=1 Tax=Lupinus albus TaxID=3870 RepID=A0A6A4NN71_LUPAL|nr:putative Phox domain-containing protein [Lupinus albus]